MNSSTAPLPTVEELAAAGIPAERAATWLSRLKELELFIAENSRYPRAHYGEVEERSLFGWLKYQKITHAEPLRRVLDQRLPGWDARRRRSPNAFADNVNAVKVYKEAHGTWPSTRSRDQDVYFLAKWLVGQRVAARAGQMLASRKALFDREVPGWDITVQETWEQTAKEIAAFRTKNGRMPSGVSKDNAERRLSRWLDDMRRGRGMSPERKAHLDEVVPGWDVTRFSKPSNASVPTGRRAA